MNQETLERIVALGALTGMRSLAGLTILALAHRSAARPLMAVATVGEMMADKTTWVGDRIDTLPLAGRAIMGAAVGAVVARDDGENAVVGGALGAVTAIAAAHLMYHARKRLPLPSVASGLLEDTVVLAIGSRYAQLANSR
jgi:uncharacterized membrane protein